VDNVVGGTRRVTIPRWTTRQIALALVAVPYLILSAVIVALLFLDGEPFDWWTFEQAAGRVWDGALYQWGAASPYGSEQPYAYRYGPLYAALMAPFTVLGLGLWRVLHVVVLAFLPWRVALIVLIFPPFWFDVQHGNVLTFAFVAGWLALNGNRWGTLAYFALLVMVPRPLMLPVAAWIVWQRPAWRLPALGFAMVGLAQLAYPGFIGALVRSAGASDVHGVLWSLPLFVGLPLGAWLTRKGRLGLASLAVSPYVLPYYGVMLLLELLDVEAPDAQRAGRKHGADAHAREGGRVRARHGLERHATVDAETSGDGG
jgi:hypothetical protein